MNTQNRFRTFTMAFLLLFGACYSYQPIRLTHDFKLGLGDVSTDRSTSIGTLGVGGGQRDRVRFINYDKKYFARLVSFSPIARINNQGVDAASKGKFREAEILFTEVLKEDPNESAGYNNLGIVYELFGIRDKAFQMYMRSCLLCPDNEYYKKNFLSFEERAPQ